MFQIEQDIIKVKASTFKVENEVVMFYSGGQGVAMFNTYDVEKILKEEPTQTE